MLETFFLDSQEFFRYLADMEMQVNTEVDIITFNMRADDFNEEPHPINEFLEKVKGTEHRILVGVPKLSECTPNCPDCRRKYNKNIERLRTYARELNIRFIYKSHFKYYRIGNTQFIGGMNLSPSGWVDYMQESENEELPNKFEQLWFESVKEPKFVTVNPNDPVSEKQRNFITQIENRLNIKSEATNKHEAHKFIQKHVSEFYKKGQ